MAKNDCRVYAKAYRQVVEKKIGVTGCKFDTEVIEVIENADDFRQCYKRGDKIREEFPKYWFISKEGFLISVKNKNKPKWIKPNTDALRPEFKISQSKKAITTYTLVALVWDSYRSEDAQKILDQKGLKAIGKLTKEKGLHIPKVQGHHDAQPYIKDCKKIENYIKNNDPQNIQIVTNREHDIQHKLKEGKKDPSIFYQPDFRNVPNDSIKSFDIESGTMLDPKRIMVFKVMGAAMLPNENDSLITSKYIFISENNREFMKEHENDLISLADFSEMENDPRKGFNFRDREIKYFKIQK